MLQAGGAGEIEIDGFADGEDHGVAIEAQDLVGEDGLAAAGRVVLAQSRPDDFERPDVAFGVADDAVRRGEEQELDAFVLGGVGLLLRWRACPCARGDRRW